jgi:hypothetical protein
MPGNQFYQINALQSQIKFYQEGFNQLLLSLRRAARDGAPTAQVLEENYDLIKREREFFLLNIAKKEELKEICSQIGVPEVGVKAVLAARILEKEFPK